MMKEVFEIDSDKVWQELQSSKDVMCVVVFPVSEAIGDVYHTHKHGCYNMRTWTITDITNTLDMKKSIESGFIRFFVRGEKDDDD